MIYWINKTSESHLDSVRLPSLGATKPSWWMFLLIASLSAAPTASQKLYLVPAAAFLKEYFFWSCVDTPGDQEPDWNSGFASATAATRANRDTLPKLQLHSENVPRQMLQRSHREKVQESITKKIPESIFFPFFFFQGHGNSKSNWIPGRPPETGPVATSQPSFQVSGIKQPLTLSYRINGGTQEPGTAVPSLALIRGPGGLSRPRSALMEPLGSPCSRDSSLVYHGSLGGKCRSCRRVKEEELRQSGPCPGSCEDTWNTWGCTCNQRPADESDFLVMCWIL